MVCAANRKQTRTEDCIEKKKLPIEGEKGRKRREETRKATKLMPNRDLNNRKLQ